MRFTLFILICCIIASLCSCSGHEIAPMVIYKSYRNEWGNKMPQGICRYGYKTMSNGSMTMFEDSCNKYDIGQIINSEK